MHKASKCCARPPLLAVWALFEPFWLGRLGFFNAIGGYFDSLANDLISASKPIYEEYGKAVKGGAEMIETSMKLAE